ncbi:MAG: HEAT repeat domain-containing protein [bacterium]
MMKHARQRRILFIAFMLFLFGAAFGIWRLANHTSPKGFTRHISSSPSSAMPKAKDIQVRHNMPSSSEKATVPRLSYHFEVGDHFTYHLQYRVDITMALAAGTTQEKSSVEISLKGLLHEMVYSIHDQNIVFGCYVEDPRVNFSGEIRHTGSGDPGIIEDALKEEVLVEMNRNGKIESLVFPKRISSDIRNILKAIMAGAQVILPVDSQKEWSNKESDLNGSYLARYSLAFPLEEPLVKIKKEKVNYTTLLEDTSAGETMADFISIGESKGNILFHREGGYIDEISLREKIEIALPGQIQQNIGSQIMCTLKLKEKTKDVSFAKLGEARWQDLIKKHVSLLRSEGESIPLLGGEGHALMEKREHEQILAGASLEDLFDTLDKLEIHDDGQLRFTTMCKLESFMYLYPEKIQGVTARLLREQNGSAAMSTILGAMETIPHLEAQAGLRDIIKLRRKEKETMLLTIPSLGHVPHPDSESEALLLDLFENEADPDISSTSILALGVMAHTLHPVDSQRAAGITEYALDALQHAHSVEEKTLYLEALGNAGHPEALGIIEDFTKDANEEIRISALDGLRNISGEKTDSIIGRALSDDESERVRSMAASISIIRPVSETLFNQLKRSYINEDSEMVRSQIIRALWENRQEYPEAVTIVKNAAEIDSSKDIRDLATSLILTTENPA